MTPTPPEFHDLTAHDLSEVVALYIRVFNASPWNDAWTEATASARLGQAVDAFAATAIAARLDERIVAVAIGHEEPWFDGVHFYLKEMFVDPVHQGTGIGTVLMHHLKGRLRARGVNRIYLLTAREGPAAEFYHRQGFYLSPKIAMMARRLNDDLDSASEE